MRVRVRKIKTTPTLSVFKTYYQSFLATRCVGFITVLCLLLMPALSLYARVQPVTLGANVSNAPEIAVHSSADITDGDENFFALSDTYLPATIYYLPDTAFGPIPYLINVVTGDTLTSQITFSDCRMAWKWVVPQSEEFADLIYLYFSTHETASAEFVPACLPVETLLPDTSICSEYQWGDTIIYDSGTYTRHFLTEIDCDSAVTQNVTILEPTFATDIITAYDSLTWINSTTYYRSITGPEYITENVVGCDSAITLQLTIRHLLTDTVDVTICQSELPYTWRGTQITEAGLHSTDTIPGKIVNTIYQDTVHTLRLTVNDTYAIDTIVTLCDSSYTWHGRQFFTSGVYSDSLLTIEGCDSVINLHLTLTDECFPKKCVPALVQIGECIVINRDLIEDFSSQHILWLCDGKQFASDQDRLPLTILASGDYVAGFTPRDCNDCDTTWTCPFSYEKELIHDSQTLLSVHPTYISAEEPFIHVSTNDEPGNYCLYGPSGRVVLHGDCPANAGQIKLTLPPISGLYVLIFIPEGEANIKHIVQKVKIIVY